MSYILLQAAAEVTHLPALNNSFQTLREINPVSLPLCELFQCPCLLQEHERSVSALANYLVGPARGEEERVRVLHRWVCEHVRYDTQGLASGNYGDLSAEGVLRSKQGVCSGWVEPLYHMSRIP